MNPGTEWPCLATSHAGETTSMADTGLGQDAAGDIIQQVTAIMIGPYASAAGNKEEHPKEELAEAEPQEPDIIQRTTHLPQASQPAFEDPKFLEEKSWWTEPTGQQDPTKVRDPRALYCGAISPKRYIYRGFNSFV